MWSKIKRGLIWLLIFLAFFPFSTVSADVGPKPGMDFKFKQELPGSVLTITSGTLFECEQSDCQDARPLQQLGPQGFSCAVTTCSALAYGFSPYHRLVIAFSNGKTRQSNVFKTTQFQATYQVTIRQDDLLVEPRFSLNFSSPLTYVLLCALCLGGASILVIAIALLIRRSARKK
jgi:hypothetical protein